MKRVRFRMMATATALAVWLCGCADGKWEKYVTEEEIVIEGLEGEYELLFLTDTHVVTRDEADPGQVSEHAAQRYGMFGSSEGVPAEKQFEEWVRYADEEDVDGVLLGGDIIDFPSESNLDFLDKQLSALEMPYLYTLGNHDWTYPWEYMTQRGREEYRPLLKKYVGDSPDVHSRDFGEFVVVAVDNSSNQINAAALSECEKIFQEDKPVIILLHVPLMTQSALTKAREAWPDTAVVLGGGNYGGIYPDETSQKFVDLVTGPESPVELILAGHVHFYDRDYVEGEKNVLQLVGDAGFKGRAVRLHLKGR